MFLTGYGSHSVSMWAILSRGNFPSTSARVGTGPMSASNDANPNFSEDMTCWLVSATELGTPVADEIVRAYLDGAPPPPRLAERMDLYFGADLVRGVVWAPEDAPPHIIERFHAALDAWGRGKAALMT